MNQRLLPAGVPYTQTKESRMTILKSIIHLLAVLGLIIALGDLLNWYKDQDRIDFFKIMAKEHRCAVSHSGAKKFLNEFLYTQNMAKDERNKKPEAIIFAGLFTAQNNETQDTYSGAIKVKTNDGYTSRELCSFEELRNWSKTSSYFWKWIGWIILTFSVLTEIGVFIYEIKKK